MSYYYYRGTLLLYYKNVILLEGRNSLRIPTDNLLVIPFADKTQVTRVAHTMAVAETTAQEVVSGHADTQISAEKFRRAACVRKFLVLYVPVSKHHSDRYRFLECILGQTIWME